MVGVQHVVEDRHPPEGVRYLEGASDPELRDLVRVLADEPLPVHLDGAPVGHELSAEHVDEGGLAGPVRADDGPYLPRCDGEVHSVERDELSETLDEPAHLERVGPVLLLRTGGRRVHAARPRSRATTFATSPAIPDGETRTTRTRITPMTSCQYSK